jgi:hypothetical protein
LLLLLLLLLLPLLLLALLLRRGLATRSLFSFHFSLGARFIRLPCTRPGRDLLT